MREMRISLRDRQECDMHSGRLGGEVKLVLRLYFVQWCYRWIKSGKGVYNGRCSSLSGGKPESSRSRLSYEGLVRQSGFRGPVSEDRRRGRSPASSQKGRLEK